MRRRGLFLLPRPDGGGPSHSEGEGVSSGVFSRNTTSAASPAPAGEVSIRPRRSDGGGLLRCISSILPRPDGGGPSHSEGEGVSQSPSTPTHLPRRATPVAFSPPQSAQIHQRPSGTQAPLPLPAPSPKKPAAPTHTTSRPPPTHPREPHPPSRANTAPGHAPRTTSTSNNPPPQPNKPTPQATTPQKRVRRGTLPATAAEVSITVNRRATAASPIPKSDHPSKPPNHTQPPNTDHTPRRPHAHHPRGPPPNPKPHQKRGCRGNLPCTADRPEHARVRRRRSSRAIRYHRQRPPELTTTQPAPQPLTPAASTEPTAISKSNNSPDFRS